MRICFISDFYATVDRPGGIGTYTRTAAHALVARGHEVHILLGREQKGSDGADGPVQIHIRRDFRLPVLARWLEGLGKSCSFAWALFVLNRRYRFDVVEIPNWEGYGFVPALLRVAPIVVRLHTSMIESVAALNRPPKLNECYMIWAEKMSARLARAVVTHSQYQWQTLGKQYDLKHARIIPHGVNVPAVATPAADGLTVLSIGSLNPRKGVDTFLAAVPHVLGKVPAAEFWIVGEDSGAEYETSFRKAHVEIPPEKVKFLGIVPDDEIASLFKRCAVYASASIHESFGLTFVEAMAHGKPVVACAASAMLETIDAEQTGLLVSPKNPTAFAEAIVRLLKDRGLREMLGRNGRMRVLERYNSEHMAEQLEEFFASTSGLSLAQKQRQTGRKAIWDLAPVKAALHNPVLNRLWKPFTPLYNMCLRKTLYRDGIPRNIGGGYELRVCSENRRLRPSEQYAREIPWLLNAVKPGVVVLDVGANIGLLSVVMGRAVTATGRVVAFEPSPLPFQCLSENIVLNRLSDTVHPSKLALGNEIGTREFFINDDPLDTQHSLTGAPGDRIKTLTVETTTLDAFCREHQITPDVIKIDVEGFEPFVLEGARTTIARAKNITVFVELHRPVWPSIGYNDKKFASLLLDLGLEAIGEGSRLDDSHVRLQKAPPLQPKN